MVIFSYTKVLKGLNESFGLTMQESNVCNADSPTSCLLHWETFLGCRSYSCVSQKRGICGSVRKTLQCHWFLVGSHGLLPVAHLMLSGSPASSGGWTLLSINEHCWFRRLLCPPEVTGMWRKQEQTVWDPSLASEESWEHFGVLIWRKKDLSYDAEAIEISANNILLMTS